VLNILGVNVQAWDQQRAIDALDARVTGSTPTCVAFANTNLLNFAASDPGLRTMLADFIVLNDGIGADIAARILYGEPFPCNLNGTDFVPAYLEHTVRSHRIFLVGARPGVVDRAATALQQRFGARHEIVGWVDGYSGIADTDAVLASIGATRASLILVGMGSARQEHWISDNMAGLGGGLAFGVGALLDFAAGDVPRAPPFIRRRHLEWAYRLALEPRRLFRRYVLEVPVFLLRVIRQRLRQGASPVQAVVASVNSSGVV
jgi:exopolysaccharide biosynthesis WecB/TagA/CpsF family protein